MEELNQITEKIIGFNKKLLKDVIKRFILKIGETREHKGAIMINTNLVNKVLSVSVAK